MKKSVTTFTAFTLSILTSILLLATLAFAHEELPPAGTTPDSPFYGLEIAFERLQLAITAGKAAKAEKGLEFAEERLAEVNAMIEQNKLEAAEKAKNEHARLITRVKIETEGLEDDEDAVEKVIRIEKRIVQNQILIQDVSRELEIKIRIKARGGNLTQEQIDRINSLINEIVNITLGAEDSVGRVKIDIKIKIREKTSKNESEIDDEIEEEEERENLTAIKQERAAEQIEDAEEAMSIAKSCFIPIFEEIKKIIEGDK